MKSKMVYIIIGGSRAGKTQVTINSFIKDKKIEEKRDLIPYTEVDDYFLIGKYSNEGRRKGTDLVSRQDIPKFFEQIVRLLEKGKDVVIEGDKITSDTLFNQLYEAGIECKLYFVKCSAETSIKRCREHNDNFKESNLKAVITKCQNRYNKWKNKFDGDIIDTNGDVDFTKISIKDVVKRKEKKKIPLIKDYGIFIISHGRPNVQKTYDYLIENGCTYPIHIVCDNLDITLADYKQNYGEKILVFDKEKEYLKTDTITNIKEMRTPVYARNKCREFAKELGYKYYSIFDDDIETFHIRYEKDGQLKSLLVEDLDFIFTKTIEFLKNNNIAGLSYPNLHFYIGGLNNVKYQDKLYPGLYGAMFLKTDEKIEFKGIINEDLNTTIHYNEVGKPLLMIMDLCFSTCKRGSNKGGLQNTYEENGEYVKAFYSLIPNPSRIIITKNLKEKRLRFGDFPKIINERWKK